MGKADDIVPDPAPPADPAAMAMPEEPPVDIHKPKPVHSIREFLSEILVIVTGILIALSLEQAVEAWHWHHQVENAEHALGYELTESYGHGIERLTVSNCVDGRLDTLAAIVDQAGETGRLPPLGDIAMPPARTWSHGVWDSTLDGQTGEHLSNDQRGGFSVTYGFVALLGSTNAREFDAWTRLYAMVGPGRSVTPTDLDELRAAISQARAFNQLMGLESVRVQQIVTSFDVALDRNFLKSFARPRSDYAICNPIGPVPAHYGSAPIANAIARAQASPIGRGFVARAVAGAGDK